jgi:hypothetical protein
VRGFALAPSADSRLAAHARPGLMQGRVELEAGVIFDEDRCPLALGFLWSRERLAQPNLLCLQICAARPFSWPLHAESELVQQIRDVLPMVFNAEAPADQLPDQSSHPDAAFETRGTWLALRRTRKPPARVSRYAGRSPSAPAQCGAATSCARSDSLASAIARIFSGLPCLATKRRTPPMERTYWSLYPDLLSSSECQSFP